MQDERHNLLRRPPIVVNGPTVHGALVQTSRLAKVTIPSLYEVNKVSIFKRKSSSSTLEFKSTLSS